MNNIKTIAVIGAGTMGNGIAQVFATSGYKVNLFDISSQSLNLATQTIDKNLSRMLAKELLTTEQKEKALSHIITYHSLENALDKVDFVVEAASEKIELKLQIFKNLDTLTHKDTILATNTSSISITQIASVTSRPDKVIGMHFMNPVPVMKLVEIINGYQTSSETNHITESLTKSLQKIPVSSNDYPGFIANRILMPMINEAIYTLFEGVAGVREIDEVMKLGMAHPMGPLTLADFIGLDVCLSILEILYKGMGNPKYAPCPLLINMVTAGKLGRKTGEGFYVYNPNSKDVSVSTFIKR